MSVPVRQQRGLHKYRADIDGLRAIAVIAVVLFHLGVTPMAGGYVGVDVFFVISGYLITQYIDNRITAGKFSILEFYERRVRRIVPALFFLLLAASVASYFTLLPQDLIKFARSEQATVLFVPNLFFYYWNSGYFETGTKLKPLLHMWSLGVEEQFYIFFPLIMWIVSRWRRGTKIASVSLLCAASFVLSCWTVQYRGFEQQGFYLLPFRAWELLLGALLALKVFPFCAARHLREIFGAMGVCAIVVAACAYTSQTAFPGVAAALPCMGAAALIYAGECGPTVAGALLSTRSMVGIGLISYSLYLWHWPILVLAKQWAGASLTIFQRASVILLSLATATASWKFIELPFREFKLGARRRILFLQATATAACLLLMAGVCVRWRGVPGRFPQQAVSYADAGYGWGTDFDFCRIPAQIEEQHRCHLGQKQGSTPDFIVWGDSHAGSFAPAFERMAIDTGSAGWIASYPACLPLLQVNRADAPGCANYNTDVLSVIERNNIKRIFLAGRWSVASLGLTSGELDDGKAQVLLFDSSTHNRSLAENTRVLDRGLRKLFARLKGEGRTVILMLDVPDTGINTPVYLARSVIQGKIPNSRLDTRLPMSAYARDSDQVDALLKRMAAEFKVLTVDPKTELCKGFECLVARDGQSLYRDSNHLSDFGALQLVDLLRPLFPQLSAESPLPRPRLENLSQAQ